MRVNNIKKISIIIPSYNHSEYIEACLDSIYFQSYPNLEIIVVDDFSTDNSREIIKQYARNVEEEMTSFAASYNEKFNTIERVKNYRYPQQGRELKLAFNKVNLGSTAAYNRGFQMATGEYCAFVVSDDICHPQMLQTLANHLDNDDADFVFSDMFIIDDNNRILREFKLPDYSFEKTFCDWYLCGVATLYRRSLHQQFGYYNEEAEADDHECYLRFAMQGARFLHVPQTLYSVRSHHLRKVGLHESDRFNKLINHSKHLTIKARGWHKSNAEEKQK